MPLCVRDDSSAAAIVIQHSVTTWQAYNRWGGYSLYYGNTDGGSDLHPRPRPGAAYADRARVVSFDRPYDYDWASGAADFVGNELPVLYQAEQLGLDVTYWTDVDLHARPAPADEPPGPDQPGPRRVLVGVRCATVPATAAGRGVNLAFLGANACYRQIRFEPSPVGPNRRQICYKARPRTRWPTSNPELVTVNWPQPPVNRPESELIGSTYQDVEAQADMVITDPGSWLFDGARALRQRTSCPDVVQGEFDRYVPGSAGPHQPGRGRPLHRAQPGGQLLRCHLVHGARWRRGVRHRQRLVGRSLANSTLIPPNVLPWRHARGDRPAAADHGEPVLGHRPGPGQPHPARRRATGRASMRPGSPSSAAPNTVNAA